MKRVISNIILFVLSITFFCLIYICVFEISIVAIGVAFVFLILYVFFFDAGQKSMAKLKKYAQKSIHFRLTNKDRHNILCLSLTTLCPIWFCIFLVSLIPFYTYEVWFITVFPAIVLNCLPASCILDEYYELTRKKLPFLIAFVLVTLICCLLGIAASHCFLNTQNTH